MNKLRALLARIKGERGGLLALSLLLAIVLVLPFSKRLADGISPESAQTFVAPQPQLPSPLPETIEYPVGKLESKSRRLIVLNSKNTVAFRGVVTSDSVAAAQAKLIAMSNALSKNDRIYLVLDTPGGSVDAGMRLIDMVAGLPQKVDTITVFAASMGFHIAQHFGNRLILPSGTLMSHRARGGVEGQLPGELNTRVNFYMAELEKEDRFIAARLGMSFEKYRDMIRDEYWIGGESSLKDRVADEVVLARCEKDLLGTEKSEIVTFFGKITLTYSQCPLVSEPLKIELAAEEKKDLSKLREFAYTLTKSRRKFVNDYVMSGRLSEFVR
jgi:ATP-dependent Clp protease protease subunit